VVDVSRVRSSAAAMVAQRARCYQPGTGNRQRGRWRPIPATRPAGVFEAVLAPPRCAPPFRPPLGSLGGGPAARLRGARRQGRSLRLSGRPNPVLAQGQASQWGRGEKRERSSSRLRAVQCGAAPLHAARREVGVPTLSRSVPAPGCVRSQGSTCPASESGGVRALCATASLAQPVPARLGWRRRRTRNDE